MPVMTRGLLKGENNEKSQKNVIKVDKLAFLILLGMSIIIGDDCHPRAVEKGVS
jgi:hypothetical protein